MKKTMAYIVTAVLLGFAVIMLPKPFETYTRQPEPFEPLSPSGREWMSDGEYALPSFGFGKPFVNLLQPAIVLLVGLIVALSAWVIFRRRTISG